MASDHKPGLPCLPPSGQNGIHRNRKNDTQLFAAPPDPHAQPQTVLAFA